MWCPVVDTDRKNTAVTVALSTGARDVLAEETWSFGLLQHPWRRTGKWGNHRRFWSRSCSEESFLFHSA